MKPILLALALSTAVVVAAVRPADAAPITIGESVTYNFDFTGQSPAPPYLAYIFVNSEVNNLVPSPGSVATVDVFTGLNDTGSLYFSGSVTLLSGVSLPSIFYLSDPGVLDGVFSIRWTVDSGEFEVLGTEAQAYNGDPLSSRPVASAEGTVASVPEPSTLVTLASGLVPFVAIVRRRASTM